MLRITKSKRNLAATALLAGFAWSASIAAAQPAGTFTATGSMLTARGYHTATLLSNGKVLITGGLTPTSTAAMLVSAAELYDPASGKFSSTGSMTVPRASHAATLLPDGRVLITGGDSSDFLLTNRAEIYDPSTGMFAVTNNMAGPRTCHHAILLRNGKVLIVGGVGGPDYPPPAELFDPAAGTFSLTGSYAAPDLDFNTCEAAAATLLADGKVLIIWQFGGAAVYDPETGFFERTGPPIGIGGNFGLPSATLLLTGKILAAGGADDGGYRDSAEFYSSGTFTPAGNMTTGRAGHTATLLPDGSVLLAGSGTCFGCANVDAPSSAELYDPARAAFVGLGAMSIRRVGHTATLLNSGRVLIAGGAYYPETSTAELYNPQLLIPAPRLFSIANNGQQGAVWHAATGELASPDSPAGVGEILSTYTSSLATDGAIPPQVAVGGKLAEVLYFGAAPGYPGYDQMNFRVPAGITLGPSVPLRLTYLERSSNEVTIGVK